MIMSMNATESMPLSPGRGNPASADSALTQLPNIFNRVLGAILAYKQRKANEAILSVLDERTLRDIGLTRLDVNGTSPRLRTHGPLAPHALHF
ncbi:MAG: DUF1127 domain-containing protein [Hyphomicrobiaceae bacterium]|nr:DUF1127 domain-containing protein [Hyphomicrobiaceae bacterium]